MPQPHPKRSEALVLACNVIATNRIERLQGLPPFKRIENGANFHAPPGGQAADKRNRSRSGTKFDAPVHGKRLVLTRRRNRAASRAPVWCSGALHDLHRRREHAVQDELGTIEPERQLARHNYRRRSHQPEAAPQSFHLHPWRHPTILPRTGAVGAARHGEYRYLRPLRPMVTELAADVR